MTKIENDARNRIIEVATELLNEVSDVEKITVRQIAERANVGIGTINYHFTSKDNLLSIVVGNAMANLIDGFLKPKTNCNLNPVQKLKTLLKELCNVAIVNQKLNHFMLTQGVLNGDMNASLYLIPFLKEIFGTKKDENELRVIAIQILCPIQIVGIAPTSFHMYSGIDVFNMDERNKLIDTLIDNLVSV